MWNKGSWTIAVALGACVVLSTLSACGSAGSEASAAKAKDKPAVVEKVSGSDTAKITLTEQAVTRLAIQTAPVREEPVAGQQRKVIPYSAVIYDAKGLAWTFTSPQARTYLRQRISVELISGDRAVLTDGPAAGTTIVTVGAAELYGAELGVGK